VFIAAAVAVSVGLGAAAFLSRFRPVPQTNPPAIAVLPFVDMSAGKSQEYFTDGLTEELIDTLAKVPGLRVVARISSFAFKSTALLSFWTLARSRLTGGRLPLRVGQ
jgi:TolB-like protein